MAQDSLLSRDRLLFPSFVIISSYCPHSLGTSTFAIICHDFRLDRNVLFLQAYNDDDWDSDFDDAPTDRQQMPPPSQIPGERSTLNVPKNTTMSGSSGDVSSIGRSDSKKASTSAAAGRTSFNRFSSFVKTGAENFVLGKISVNVQENDVIQVVVCEDGTKYYGRSHLHNGVSVPG